MKIFTIPVYGHDSHLRHMVKTMQAAYEFRFHLAQQLSFEIVDISDIVQGL